MSPARIDAKTFERWNRDAAEFLANANLERVPELLIEALCRLVQADTGLVAVYSDSTRPILLYDNAPGSIRYRHVESYFEGAYLLDPVYRAGMGGAAQGVYRLRDVAPDGFKQSEYYKQFYSQSLICDEIDSIVHLSGGFFANISISMVEGSPRFRKSHFDLVAQVLPIAETALLDHWAARTRNGDDLGPRLHSQLERALGKFGSSVLTARECEITRLYLHGHSTRSIAEQLNISAHTVSMHRKNAYSKLDVTSQLELFHLFIESLCCAENALESDPLERYLAVRRK